MVALSAYRVGESHLFKSIFIMELILSRVYHSEGVNGVISVSGRKVCSTIELPWKENEFGISCIPEGKYVLRLRSSERFKEHLEILDVPERRGILIHPANYALTELRGCIAPVLKTIAPGKGVFSRNALAKVLAVSRPIIEKKKVLYLIIKS